MSSSSEPLTLDVRPLLAKGIEPLGKIIEAKRGLKPGQCFVLRAPFEPIPLYAVFREEGYHIEARQIAGGDWEVQFVPAAGESGSERELDVRSLEPLSYLPDTLAEIRALGPDERLLLHTGSRPAELLEQLEAETIDFDCEEVGSNHWMTAIWRIAR